MKNKIDNIAKHLNLEVSVYKKALAEYFQAQTLSKPIHAYSYPIIDTLIGVHKPNLRMHIYGRPMSSKTALAINMAIWAIEVHKWNVLWIDAGAHFPDYFIMNQLNDLTYLEKIDKTYSLDISEACEATKYYDLIIIDDMSSLTDEFKNNYSKLTTAAGLNNCRLITITQVRRDILVSRDLVPDCAVSNSDIILNLVRAEQVDNLSYKYRYTCTIKGYRGQVKTKTCSYTCDHLGIDLAQFIIQHGIRKSYYQRVGIRIAEKGKILGTIKEYCQMKRFEYKQLGEIWRDINEIEH